MRPCDRANIELDLRSAPHVGGQGVPRKRRRLLASTTDCPIRIDRLRVTIPEREISLPIWRHTGLAQQEEGRPPVATHKPAVYMPLTFSYAALLLRNRCGEVTVHDLQTKSIAVEEIRKCQSPL